MALSVAQKRNWQRREYLELANSRYVGPYKITNKYNSNYEIRGVYVDKDVQTVRANRIDLAVLRDAIAFPFNNAVSVAQTNAQQTDGNGRRNKRMRETTDNPNVNDLSNIRNVNDTERILSESEDSDHE